MSISQLSPTERDLLLELAAASYRRQHRESWEVSRLGGEATIVAEAVERLKVLESIVIKLGGSLDEALREEGVDGQER